MTTIYASLIVFLESLSSHLLLIALSQISLPPLISPTSPIQYPQSAGICFVGTLDPTDWTDSLTLSTAIHSQCLDSLWHLSSLMPPCWVAWDLCPEEPLSIPITEHKGTHHSK